MIRMFDYQALLPEIRDDMDQAFHRVLDSGRLILGPETEAFEREFAAATGARYAVAVTSGTMALYVALKALDIGQDDEVITVANTCSPTIAAIRMAGAHPVFVDVDSDTLMMDTGAVSEKVTARTRCILPVHLWGSFVDASELNRLSSDLGIPVVEDCAQAMGTRYADRQAGTFGAMGCFSFYPTKNLGAYGDGGAVVTNDSALAAKLRLIRMYGYDGSAVSEIAGVNARINELQAAFLRIKLEKFPNWQNRRLANAEIYNKRLAGIARPKVPDHVVHSYHQYVVLSENRESVMSNLLQNGVESGIHYPVPVHRMPAYNEFCVPLPTTESAATKVLSLPVHEGLVPEQIETVCRQILKISDF